MGELAVLVHREAAQNHSTHRCLSVHTLACLLCTFVILLCAGRKLKYVLESRVTFGLYRYIVFGDRKYCIPLSKQVSLSY